MIIKKISAQEWQVKTKDSIIKLDGGIAVGNFQIPGVGEYEIAGVEIEVIDGIANIVAEDLNLVFFAREKKDLSEIEAKKLSKIDIFFIPVAGKDTMDEKTALKIIGEIDPKIVIPIYYDKLEKFTKSEGISAENMPQFKITKNNLPEEEERKVIIL